jgi:hypothetical protein
MISDDEYLERIVAGIQDITSQDADVTWNEMINGRQFDVVVRFKCKNWYSTLRTVSDHGAHRGHTNDSSVRAFAVKARASGAPLRGFGP